MNSYRTTAAVIVALALAAGTAVLVLRHLEGSNETLQTERQVPSAPSASEFGESDSANGVSDAPNQAGARPSQAIEDRIAHLRASSEQMGRTPAPFKANAELTIEAQIAPGGVLQATAARQQLFGNFEALVAELNSEMSMSQQSAEIAELYTDQMKALLEQRGSGASLLHLACGKSVCAAEVSTPPGGAQGSSVPVEDRVRIPLDAIQRVTFETEDGTSITRMLFTPPRD